MYLFRRSRTFRDAARMLDVILERARQAGYDDGYDDGYVVGRTAPLRPVPGGSPRRPLASSSAAHQLSQ